MTRCFLLVACAFALTVGAFGQTKSSGSIDCDKSEPSYAIPIPDREGYAYTIGQNKCSWTKSMAIEGLDSKGFVNTAFNEVMGASVRIANLGVTTFSNGDKAYERGTGTGDVKKLTMSGKWTFSGGTGKLRGIKGGGTYTCKSKSSEVGSGYTCDVEGEYTLPVAKKQ